MERNPSQNNIWYEGKQSRRSPEQPPLTQRSMRVGAVIAEFMLWMSMITDKASARRAVRRAAVLKRWIQLSGSEFQIPFPGVVLL